MNPPNLVERRGSDRGMGRASAHPSASVGGAKEDAGEHSLGELAERFGCTVQGNSEVRLTHVSILEEADSEAIVFVANPKYLPQLASTHAGAVILSPQYARESPIPALIARNPYATYARIASVLHPFPTAKPGVHPTAVVARSARLEAGVSIGP